MSFCYNKFTHGAQIYTTRLILPMALDSKPTDAYWNHRENQRERILEVAERLFIGSGIDQVSLSDIARTTRKLSPLKQFDPGFSTLFVPFTGANGQISPHLKTKTAVLYPPLCLT
jgi:hypothetical protein